MNQFAFNKYGFYRFLVCTDWFEPVGRISFVYVSFGLIWSNLVWSAFGELGLVWSSLFYLKRAIMKLLKHGRVSVHRLYLLAWRLQSFGLIWSNLVWSAFGELGLVWSSLFYLKRAIMKLLKHGRVSVHRLYLLAWRLQSFGLVWIELSNICAELRAV